MSLSSRKTFFLISIANSGNLAAYLFQVLSARAMHPVDYGLFNAFNSLIKIVNAFIPIGTMLVAKMTITISHNDKQMLTFFKNFLFKISFFLASIIWLLGFFSFPFLQHYFKTSENWSLCFLIAQAGCILFIPLYVGMFQGLRFYVLQAITLAFLNWGRLIIGSLLFFDGGFTVSEALFCIFISTLLVVFIMSIILNYKLLGSKNIYIYVDFKTMLKKELKLTLPYLSLSYFVMAFFLNADVIFARHYLSSQEEVGFYAIAAILGRIAFYLPEILMAVLFSESLRRTENFTLLKVGGLGGLVSFSFSTICWLAPQHLIRILMGAKYLKAAPYLKVIALGMSFLAFANMLFTYFLGKERYGYLYGFVSLAALTCGAILWKFHHSPMEIALTLTVGSFFILLWAGWYCLNGKKSC